MARAAKKTTGARSEKSAMAAAPKDRIIDALMALAAEERFEEITLKQIAGRANVSLAEFREHFSSRYGVLAAFGRRIDRIVLEGVTDDLAEENDRERLFDVLMRRFDAMAPYREALRGVTEWARREPFHAALLSPLAVNSMRFMLEAAGIDTGGRIGRLKARGLTLAWARIANIWLDDNDPGFARTMAELDRALTRGEKVIARAQDVDRLVSPLRAMARGAAGACWRFARDGARRRRDRRDADVAANEI